MIYARFIADRDSGSLTLKMRGHSAAAEKGQDTICAGASTLATSCAQCMQILHSEDGLKKEPNIHLQDGHATITVVPKPERFAEALCYMYMCQVGLYLLQRSFPKNVKVIPFDKSIADFSIEDSPTSRAD